MTNAATIRGQDLRVQPGQGGRDVTPQDVTALGDLLDEFVRGAYGGAAMDPADRTKIVNRASQLYGDKTKDPSSAIADAFAEVMGPSPTTENPWFGPSRVRPAPAPAAPAAPAAPRPAPGGAAQAAPQRPASVPAGSAYSPSRQMWRAPDGTLFTADGRPAT